MTFIDFKKTFDSLFKRKHVILMKNGVVGKLHQCIRSMYTIVKARAKCGAQFTECINCTKGVKQ